MSKKNALIVDDSPITRKQLAKILSAEGFDASRSAMNGIEALEIFEKEGENIDLVTLDITMPAMSGTTVLEKILTMRPETRVIMVSAIGKESVIQECIKKGARHFITKPFDRARVASVLSRVVA